jgi:ribosomal protein S1
VPLTVGTQATGRVLDIACSTGIVDLTLKPNLQVAAASIESGDAMSAKKKLKKAGGPYAGLKVGDAVSGVLQLVKDTYFVVTLSGMTGTPVAFALTQTPNLRLSPHTVFKVGQECSGVVAEVPQNDSGRLLLVLDLSKRIALHASKGEGKRSMLFFDPAIKSRDQLQEGTTVKVQVTEVLAQGVTVSLGQHVKNIFGKVWKSQLPDDGVSHKPGALIDARIVKRTVKGGDRGPLFLDFSLRSVDAPVSDKGAASRATAEVWSGRGEVASMQAAWDWSDLTVGQSVTAWVTKVEVPDVNDEDANASAFGLVVALNSHLGGRIHVLDVSDDLDVLHDLETHYPVGTAVQCLVRSVRVESHRLHLSMKHVPLLAGLQQAASVAATPGKKKDGKRSALAVKEVDPASVFGPSAATAVGRVVAAQVTKVDASRGLLLRLGPSVLARAHLTDLSDHVRLRPTRAYDVDDLVLVKIMARTTTAPANRQVNDDDDDDDDDDDVGSQKKKGKKVAAPAAATEELWVSLRDSDTGNEVDEEEVAGELPFPSLASFAAVKDGQLAVGYVFHSNQRLLLLYCFFIC